MHLKGSKTYLPGVITVLFCLVGLTAIQAEVVNLQFAQPTAGSDTSRTLESLVRVQGTGQFCQDGLYLMTHYGDRAKLFQDENQSLIDDPLLNRTWRHCTVFSVEGDSTVIMGRNWDNQSVGSVIVSLCYPTDGYASISFCRSIDLGFGHKDLLEHKSSMFGPKLLLAPFYATEGINEHGLAVAVTGNRATDVAPQSDRELVYATFLIRKILDQTKDIAETIELVEQYIPFDINGASLNSHFMVTDVTGSSAILEYGEGRWRKIRTDQTWQVLSTKPVFDVPDSDLREQCWRYRTASVALETSEDEPNWQFALRILKDVSQHGTTWSVVYSPTAKDLHFSVYQDWNTVYRTALP